MSELRQVVIGILEQVGRGGSSSVLLERAVLDNAVDRGLATELVLGVLRRQTALDRLLEPVCDRPLATIDPRVRIALRVGIYQLVFLDRVPVHAAVGESVEAIKRLSGPRPAGFVNGVLRGFVRGRPVTELAGPEEPWRYLTETLSLPAFLAERWCKRFGTAITTALAAAAVRAPRVALRVIRGRSSQQEVIDGLGREGVEASPGRYLPEAVLVERGSVVGTRVLGEGLAIVQDEAAQLVARLVDARPGHRILDLCSAPGGKTIALADQAGGGALVVAADLRPRRLERLRANVSRCRVATVQCLVCDGIRPSVQPGFDRILVDAPCTGTGTIRRNPEIRYRVDRGSIERAAERARRMVTAAWQLLRLGGRLVYSTCSLEPEENEAVMEWLLDQGLPILRLDPRPSLPPRAADLVGTDRVLRTQPGDVELDGLTAAVFERTA